MNHAEAYESHAAERYLLGELPAEEAEQFERHYFECQRCAMAVESGAEFIENARAVFREESPAESGGGIRGRERNRSAPARWRDPAFAVPLAAAILFAALATYQSAVLIPDLRRGLDSPRALPAFQLMGASRGEHMVVTVPPDAPSFALSMDIPPDVHFARYLCVLGGIRLAVAAPRAGQPVTILLPVAKVSPGDHQVMIYGLAPDGSQADKISTYSFYLQSE